jgi:hypothetical protein
MSRRRLGLQIRREIARLDPVSQHEEIARLTYEVLYGDPMAVHLGYLVGFARQMAVPSIARVVYRGGGGDMLRHAARRNDETLAIFGEFLHHGYSSRRGTAAIARMEAIHSRFRITDEQKRYTLATLIFERDRQSELLGLTVPPGEREARFRFWKGVADQMPLTGVPDDAEEYWQWTRAYEREHWAFSQGGRAVVETMFDDWTTRWFPPALRALGRGLMLALMEGELRDALGLEPASAKARTLLRAGARAGSVLVLLRPIRLDRGWTDSFGRHLGALDPGAASHDARRAA